MKDEHFSLRNRKFQIVLLEDNIADAELIAHELEAAGLSFSLARAGDGVGISPTIKGQTQPGSVGPRPADIQWF